MSDFDGFITEQRAVLLGAFFAGETARLERIAAEEAAAETERQMRMRIPVMNMRPGSHSDLWWQAVAICEQGGRNHPFFGFFSIMDGSAGGLDWATQVGMANQIIARAGDGAWAASCVAAGYRNAPGG